MMRLIAATFIRVRDGRGRRLCSRNGPGKLTNTQLRWRSADISVSDAASEADSEGHSRRHLVTIIGLSLSR